MPNYEYTATACPAVQVPVATFYAGAATPTPVVGTALASGPSGAGGLVNLVNADQVRGNLLGRYGGGGYAVWDGLELSAGSGRTLNVSAGHAGADGPAEITAATTLELTDNVFNRVWLSRLGVLSKVTSSSAAPLDPPDEATQWVFLGTVPVAGGAILGIDYSGRVQQDQGSLMWRRTADAGEPADTPPSTVRFVTRTQDGLYLWDGVEYWRIGTDGAATDAELDDLESDTEDLRDLFHRLLMRVFRSPLGECVASDSRLQTEILRAAAAGL